MNVISKLRQLRSRVPDDLVVILMLSAALLAVLYVFAPTRTTTREVQDPSPTELRLLIQQVDHSSWVLEQQAKTIERQAVILNRQDAELETLRQRVSELGQLVDADSASTQRITQLEERIEKTERRHRAILDVLVSQLFKDGAPDAVQTELGALRCRLAMRLIGDSVEMVHNPYTTALTPWEVRDWATTKFGPAGLLWYASQGELTYKDCYEDRQDEMAASIDAR